jgi:hypothetical protein
MNAIDTTKTDLHWNLLTIKGPGLVRDLPAGKEELRWVAFSSTLISGERDAILVDTLLTTEQSQTLLDWAVASGKNLTAIYITHGHGDHFFGLASLLERFPRARAVATPEVVKAMHEQLSTGWLENIWRRLYPGEIPDRLLMAEPLKDNDLELEGAQACRGERGADRYSSLHLFARPVDRTDRWRGRRLQRNSSLSWRDRHTEPAGVDLDARQA